MLLSQRPSFLGIRPKDCGRDAGPLPERRTPPRFTERGRRGQLEWSGRPDSNRRHRPWQGRTLPTELLPLVKPFSLAGGIVSNQAGVAPSNRFRLARLTVEVLPLGVAVLRPAGSEEGIGWNCGGERRLASTEPIPVPTVGVMVDGYGTVGATGLGKNDFWLQSYRLCNQQLWSNTFYETRHGNCAMLAFRHTSRENEQLRVLSCCSPAETTLSIGWVSL